MNNSLINGRVAWTIVDYRWWSRIVLQPLKLNHKSAVLLCFRILWVCNLCFLIKKNFFPWSLELVHLHINDFVLILLLFQLIGLVQMLQYHRTAWGSLLDTSIDVALFAHLPLCKRQLANEFFLSSLQETELHQVSQKLASAAQPLDTYQQSLLV